LGGKAYKLQYAHIMKEWRPVPTDISVPIDITVSYTKEKGNLHNTVSKDICCQKGKSTYTQDKSHQ
jgi:hypothetical protein